MNKSTVIFSIVMGGTITLEFLLPINIPFLSAFFTGFFIPMFSFSQIIFLSFVDTSLIYIKLFPSYAMMSTTFQGIVGFPLVYSISWFFINYTIMIPINVGLMYMVAFILKKIHPKYYDYMRSLK